MTSAAATVNVTFGGSDYTDIDGIFLNSIIRGGPGELPEVAGRDDEIPGLEGVFVRNRIGRTRTIELRGWVRGVASTEATDRDDYWANREALELPLILAPRRPSWSIRGRRHTASSLAR